MRRVYYFFASMATCMLLFSYAPASETGKTGSNGAPGEGTCTSCHGGAAGGSVNLTSDIPASGFVSGMTYNLVLTVSQVGFPLFGMGIESLSSANTQAGTLIAGTGTQVQTKSARQNLIHTFNGGLSANSKAFSFKWTAPAVAAGNVTFYYAGLAANANGVEDSGDYTYTGSASVSPATAASVLTLNCPSDITIAAVTGATSAVANYTAPTGTSTCVTGSVSTTKTSGLASGSAFPIGMNAVCYSATDGCGNTKNCCFNVIVTAPAASVVTMNCPTDITLTAATGSTSALATYTAPTGTSTCTTGSVTTTKTSGLASGSAFPIGTTAVCYSATDGCGTTKNCCFNVTVTAAAPTVLTLNCPAPISLTAATGATSAIATYTAPVGTSNCATGSVTTTKTSGLASGSAFPIGTSAVCYTATDACGNTKNCCFNVTVTAAAPAILTLNCAANVNVTAAAGATSAVANYNTPTGTSTCATGSVRTTKTSGLASGSAFPIGTSSVCFTATDGCGNTKNCCFNVTVTTSTTGGGHGDDNDDDDDHDKKKKDKDKNKGNHLITQTGNYAHQTQQMGNADKLGSQQEVSIQNISNNSKQTKLGLSPNPAANLVDIDVSAFKGQTVKLLLVNQIGKVVLTKTIQEVNGTITLSLENMADGFYYVTLLSDGVLQSNKLVINKSN
jgi:hypothetical protein